MTVELVAAWRCWEGGSCHYLQRLLQCALVVSLTAALSVSPYAAAAAKCVYAVHCLAITPARRRGCTKHLHR